MFISIYFYFILGVQQSGYFWIVEIIRVEHPTAPQRKQKTSQIFITCSCIFVQRPLWLKQFFNKNSLNNCLFNGTKISVGKIYKITAFSISYHLFKVVFWLKDSWLNRLFVLELQINYNTVMLSGLLNNKLSNIS